MSTNLLNPACDTCGQCGCNCDASYDEDTCSIVWDCPEGASYAELRKLDGLSSSVVAVGQDGIYPVWEEAVYVLDVYCNGVEGGITNQQTIDLSELTLDEACIYNCNYYDVCAEEFRVIPANLNTCIMCGCHRGGLIYGEFVVTGFENVYSQFNSGPPGDGYTRTFTGLDAANGTYIYTGQYNPDTFFCDPTPAEIIIGTVTEEVEYVNPADGTDYTNNWILKVNPMSSGVILSPGPGNPLGGFGLFGPQTSSTSYPETDDYCAYDETVHPAPSYMSGMTMETTRYNIRYMERPRCS